MSEVVKFPLRISKEIQEKILYLHKLDNCSSQNEFILKAIDFYFSYLECQKSTAYLSMAISNSIEGSLADSENRVANSIYRLAVEVAMIGHMLAVILEISDDSLEKLRSQCIRDVRKNKGNLRIDKIIRDEGESPNTWQD